MKSRSKKNKNGCLWSIVLAILSFFGSVFIKFLFQIPAFSALLIGVTLSFLFLAMILGKSYRGSLLRSGIFLFLLFYGILFLGKSLLSNLNIEQDEQASFTVEEKIVETSVIEESDTLKLFTSHRIWRDNYGNNFSGSLSVRERDYLRLKTHINNYRPPSRGYFWANLYDYIERTDTPSLDLVIDAFEEINRQNNLNRMEFAEMVVSCIQDIPYSLVFQGTCEPAEFYEESIKKILEDCPDCCIGNITYGIQNPVSFLQNLKGDCDTRTVLIYSILKHFNYDIAIVNSEFYRHSILGINMPARGLHKIHNGKKYVLWETTAKYFEIGNLSPNFNNVAHWNVILTSK